MARELKITPLIIRGENLKAQGFGGQCKRAEGNSGEKSKGDLSKYQHRSTVLCCRFDRFKTG